MLGEDADEALDGAEAHAMDHDRALLLAVLGGILQVEVQRHLEVQLDGAALPGASDAVLEVEVDLRAVERAVALVDGVVQTQLLQRALQAVGRGLPVLVGAHGVLRAGGQLDEVLEAELGVDLVDQVHDVGDLVGDLVGAHEDVRVVLGEAAHAEQAVQRAAQLVAVHQTQLAHAQRQLAVGVGLAAIDQHAAGAVHGLHAVDLVVDHGGVHVVLVMIPVAAGLPQLAIHDQGRGDLHIAVFTVQLAPVLDQRVLQNHAVGQEEGEADGLVAHHEQLHFLADLAVVAAGGLLHQLQVRVQLLLGGEGDAVDAGEHLVVLVALPVRAGLLGDLEGLQRLGVGQVRADAHVHVVALLEEGNLRVLRQVVDVLQLVLLVPLLHQRLGLRAGQNEGLDGQVLLHDLLHLGFDLRQILVGELGLAQIHVIVEAVVGRGAVGEVRVGIEALDGLRHDVCCGVANDVQLLLLGALCDDAVLVDDLHVSLSFSAFRGEKTHPRTLCSKGALNG